MAQDLSRAMAGVDLRETRSASDTATQQWDYKLCPLVGDKATRFVELFGAAEDAELVIGLRALKSDEQEKMSHAALSYCWGPPDFTHSVYIGQEPQYELKITPSLDAALRTVRKKLDVGRSILLWVDGICINQADDIEKAQQIPLMPLIYPKSLTTFCYIGDSHDVHSTGVKFIEEYGVATTTFDAKLQTELAQRVRREISSTYQPVISTIRSIFSRDWFERVWCIQEGHRPLANGAVVLCGDYMIDLQSLIFSVVSLGFELDSKEVEALFGDRSDIIFSIFWIQSTDREDFVLSRLLGAITRHRATIPRDKLYALLGLLSDVDKLPKPDYGVSDAEVCISFTRAILEREERLLILQMLRPGVRSAKDRASLPSWSLALNEAMIDPGVEEFRPQSKSDNRVRYSASCASKPDLVGVQTASDPVLRLRAQLVDTAKEVRLPRALIEHWNSEVKTWLEFKAQLQGLAELLNLAPDSLQALASSLCCGRFIIGPGRDERDFDRLYLAYTRQYASLQSSQKPTLLSADELRAYCDQRLTLDSPAINAEQVNRLGVPQDWFEKQVIRTVLEQASRTYLLFVTAHGRVGGSFNELHQGDALYLVPGSTTPLLFKTVEGFASTYTYLGEAYLHGVMHGEAYNADALTEIAIH